MAAITVFMPIMMAASSGSTAVVRVMYILLAVSELKMPVWSIYS
jgi:hypothetical protein